MKNKNYFWGLFFITAAAVILINQLDCFGKINLFSLVTTIVLIPIILRSIFKLEFVGILFPLAFLGIIYDNQLGITELTPWPILAIALFASIGLSLIFKQFKIKHMINHENFDDIINVDDDQTIDLAVSFGSCIKYINTEDFQKININASFAGMKVYFDNAKIVNDKAIINLNLSFSGVELYIPKDWKIVNNVDISLGGIEEKTKNNNETTKTVYLNGKISLTGIEIIYI